MVFDIVAALKALGIGMERMQSILDRIASMEVVETEVNVVDRVEKVESFKKAEGKLVLTAEEKKKKLNERSIEQKKQEKQLMLEREIQCNGLDHVEDQHGISEVDRRRYKQCFSIYQDNSLVNVEYVMRMTGLTIYQIGILEKETKLVSNKLRLNAK